MQRRGLCALLGILTIAVGCLTGVGHALALPPEGIVIDDNARGTYPDGTPFFATQNAGGCGSATGAGAGFDDTQVSLAPPAFGGCFARWNFKGLAQGSYEVLVTFREHPNPARRPPERMRCPRTSPR